MIDIPIPRVLSWETALPATSGLRLQLVLPKTPGVYWLGRGTIPAAMKMPAVRQRRGTALRPIELPTPNGPPGARLLHCCSPLAAPARRKNSALLVKHIRTTAEPRPIKNSCLLRAAFRRRLQKCPALVQSLTMLEKSKINAPTSHVCNGVVVR